MTTVSKNNAKNTVNKHKKMLCSSPLNVGHYSCIYRGLLTM